VGNGLDPTVEMGPLINGSQLNRVTSYIASGQQQGATLAAGGERPGGLDASLSNGFFLSPTVFVDVHEDMRIVKEEIFGPVVTVSRWKTHDELLHMANDSEYGLGAGIWTSNLRTAHRLAERIEAGSVWINCFNLVDPATAFGGVKQSGWGREMGRYAMEMYSETKSVWVNIT
jgi:phenylacetaldehyde dehydrogenase